MCDKKIHGYRIIEWYTLVSSSFFFITNSAVYENLMYRVFTRLMHQVDFKKIITRQIRARFIGKFLLLKK